MCSTSFIYIHADLRAGGRSTVVLKTFTERDWIENFRMSKQTFHYLCDQIRAEIFCENTNYRLAIPVEKRVAIALWCLATPAEYRTIGHLFGVARCTVCIIVKEVCNAIVRILQPRYIYFPSGEELQSIINGFERMWGVPQCVGAIDGSHIPVLGPKNHHTDYYNRKGWYSVRLSVSIYQHLCGMARKRSRHSCFCSFISLREGDGWNFTTCIY